MSIKGNVSSSYLKAQVNQHGDKPVNIPPNCVITGAGKPNSIGAAIYNQLKPNIVIWGGDVRERIEKGLFELYDTLIMCHGVTYLDWFEDMPYQKAMEIFDVNLWGCFNVAQAFVNDTINKSYRKRIIMVGSMAHRAVLNGSSAYCASKAGQAHLARCLAWELAPKGYDVYIIHPSNTADTPMTKETVDGLIRYRGLTQNEALAYWNDSPIRARILTAGEIAELIHSIVNGLTPYLSGAQIELGGGQRC